MRTVPQTITDAWESGDFAGTRRPMARVTIQRLKIQLQKIDSTRLFASAMFGQADIPRELPNVKSVEWDRSVGADVANATIVFYNTTPLPLGEQPVTSGDFDLPGYYTYNYGATSWATSRWGQQANTWQDYLVPDRILRTYEGYGFDATEAPESDPHLVQTGVWLIDDVECSSEGLITVTCRDVGRLLLDHMCFPPVIPLARYPLTFDPMHPVANPNVVTPLGGSFRPTYSKDSNIPYVGRNGLVYGHRASHAFDKSTSTYWLSIGNALPHADYSYEYVEGNCSGRTVAAVQFRVYGGPYRCYLSVKVGGRWQGTKIVPYDPDNPASAPNGANVAYLVSQHVTREATTTITLAHPITHVDAVRLTFTGLFNSGIGTYKYRAGVRDFLCYSQQQSTRPGGTHQVGDFSDYTEVVKYLLACGGFHWPKTTNGYLTYSDGTKHTLQPSANDTYLVSGRIWGDMEMCGTGPYVDPVTGIAGTLKADIFDKKPLMDGIAHVRDILGFLFLVDENGAAVFRMPNVYTLGNWVGNMAADAGYQAGTNNILTIDERTTLIGLRAKTSSRNIRDWVFVTNTNGNFGSTAAGYNPITPNPGLRRVGGWCVDTETEILTQRGWLTYDQVSPGDQTLSIDETTGRSVWQAIKTVEIFDHAERQMWQFRSNNFSCDTTADHRWLVQTYSTSQKRWTWRWRQSQTLSSLDRIPRALPRQDVPNSPIFSDALVELVAWTYTEGSVRGSGDGRRITLDQSERVNPDNCARIRQALKEELGPPTTMRLGIGIGWRERSRPDRPGAVNWYLSREASAPIMSHLGQDNAPTMEFLRALTQQQLELFIDVAVAGDGWTRRTSINSKQKSRFFAQQIGPRLDAFEAACALAGIGTSRHEIPIHKSSYTKRPKATVTLLQSRWYHPVARPNRGAQVVNVAGIVWCPTMPDHHTWLARRDGSVFFTGNTDQHFASAAEAQKMADLITVRQAFTYRRDTLTIIANPAIQVDDQVRLYERVTGEGYYHYVQSIRSSNNLEEGKWTYDLVTNWLGEDPFGTWVFDRTALQQATKDFIAAIIGNR